MGEITLNTLGHNLLGSNIFNISISGLVSNYIVATLFTSYLIRVPFHRINIVGLTSLFWSGHLVHCSILVSKRFSSQLILSFSEFYRFSSRLDAFN